MRRLIQQFRKNNSLFLHIQNPHERLADPIPEFLRAVRCEDHEQFYVFLINDFVFVKTVRHIPTLFLPRSLPVRCARFWSL